MPQLKSQKNYYIFRHGETFATKRKIWYFHKLYSATILEEGKPSVIRLAQYLKNIKTDFNVSSPFLRCKQTSELITQETGKEFVYDARLGERTFEMSRRYKLRLINFINEMEKSDYKNILICTHGTNIKFINEYLAGTHISNKDLMRAPRPGVLSIVKSGNLEEMDFNEQ